MQKNLEARLSGEAGGLLEPLPFHNFVAQARPGVSHEEHEEFFRRLLGDVQEPTAPFGLLDHRIDGAGIDQAKIAVDSSLARSIRERCGKLGISAASLFHLAWAQVLARASGREDIVFGAVLFGPMQSGAGADWTMGLFNNPLPVRIRVGEEGVEASVRRTHAQLAELMRHQHASLALAQRCSSVPAPTPLFSALLRFICSTSAAQSAATEASSAWGGVETPYTEEGANYPLTLSVSDFRGTFVLAAQAPAEIGAKRVCEFMLRALEGLVSALETAPTKATNEIDVLPETERRQLLLAWNDARADFPRDKCIHELFEAQAQEAPERNAVVFEGAVLSYAELNQQANRLAHYLRELGVAPDMRVAICVERGFDMIVAVLAVLKAGGAYVPLDPAYPAERLDYMLDDSAPTVLLTQGRLKGIFKGLSQRLPVIDLSADSPRWANQPDSNPDRASVGLTPEHLSYVIYTSGSTGKPKGVMVEHRGVCNLAVAQAKGWGVDSGSRVLQFAPFSFDACVSEIFMALTQGAQLHMPSSGALVGQPLLATIKNGGVTHVTLPPPVLATLPDDSELTPVRTLIIAGSAPGRALVGRWAGRLRLFNGYGPTETTVCASWFECLPDAEGAPPIGRPMQNVRIYILDKMEQPVPIGVVGEIHIGGVGVARGYLNRPEMAAKRFVEDPFVGTPGARMYKSGDLGRYLPDGNIEFLGRNDDQVKIRGFRIELGEIEARLAQHPAVKDAVVLAREDEPGEQRLVAYYVAAPDAPEPRPAALRRHLSAALPDYMVPAAYVPLGAAPLTVNGKLDRKALPAPDAAAFSAAEYEAPANETETRLARIWAEAVKFERIGRHDNFFELGGHSLLATRVASGVFAAFGLRLPLRTLFECPTLAGLAEQIDALLWARDSSEEAAPLSTAPLEEGFV